MDSLNLDPQGKFAEEIGEWSDGETYNVQAKIRQTAPGKFEVVELTEADETAELGEGVDGNMPGKGAGAMPAKKSMMAGTHAPIVVLMGGKK